MLPRGTSALGQDPSDPEHRPDSMSPGPDGDARAEAERRLTSTNAFRIASIATIFLVFIAGAVEATVDSGDFQESLGHDCRPRRPRPSRRGRSAYRDAADARRHRLHLRPHRHDLILLRQGRAPGRTRREPGRACRDGRGAKPDRGRSTPRSSDLNQPLGAIRTRADKATPPVDRDLPLRSAKQAGQPRTLPMPSAQLLAKD